MPFIPQICPHKRLLMRSRAGERGREDSAEGVGTLLGIRESIFAAAIGMDIKRESRHERERLFEIMSQESGACTPHALLEEGRDAS